MGATCKRKKARNVGEPILEEITRLTTHHVEWGFLAVGATIRQPKDDTEEEP